MRTKKILLAALLLGSTTIHAQPAIQSTNTISAIPAPVISSHNSKKKEKGASSHKTENSLFDAAAPKFVTVLEAQILSLGLYQNWNQQLEELTVRLQNEGFTDELVLDYQATTNLAQAQVANDIGISVFDLPDFYRYFYNNIAQYVPENSAVYAEIFSDTPKIMPVERIRVVCNGLHCNSRSGPIQWVRIASVFNEYGIGSTQSADLRFVDDNGTEYPDSSGVWRNNGAGDFEYIGATERPCPTCNLN